MYGFFARESMVRTRERGFTFIELVVVIGLIAGLTTVISINAVNARRVTNLDNAVQEVMATIRLAQALGWSGTVYDDGTTKCFDCGHGVYFDTTGSSDTNYRLYAGKVSGGNMNKYTSNSIETRSLPRGVTLSKVCGTNNDALTSCTGASNKLHVLFRRGESLAHLEQGASAYNYALITLAAGSDTRTIKMTATGLTYAL